MEINEKEMNKIKQGLYVSIVHVIYSIFTSNIFLSFINWQHLMLKSKAQEFLKSNDYQTLVIAHSVHTSFEIMFWKHDFTVLVEIMFSKKVCMKYAIVNVLQHFL